MPDPKPKAPTATVPENAAKVKQVKAFELDSELVAARFSPCGKFLLTGSYDAHIYRFDIADGTKTVFGQHKGWLQGLVFHPDGKRMYTGDSWGGINCFEYADKTPEPKWTRADSHARWMRSLAISPDGALLATCGADKVVRLWSAEDGSPKGETPVQADDLMCVRFHPKGKSLVVGDLKGVVAELELPALKPKRQLDAKILYLRPIASGVPEINDVGGIRCISFNAEGTSMACAGSQPATSGFFTGKPTIVVLNWESGERQQMMQWENADPSEGIVLDVGWHIDGYVMAASSGQQGKGAFYCWKPGERVPFHLDKKLTHCRSVSAHPDGQRIAVVQVASRAGQSGGNGRKEKADSAYFGLMSKITLWEFSTI